MTNPELTLVRTELDLARQALAETRAQLSTSLAARADLEARLGVYEPDRLEAARPAARAAVEQFILDYLPEGPAEDDELPEAA